MSGILFFIFASCHPLRCWGSQKAYHTPKSYKHLREYFTISPHHPGAAQDQTFYGKPGSNSIGYAVRTGVGHFNADMWRWGLSKSQACDCGADQQTANHIVTECPHTVRQMVSMAWLMLMQMQQLMSGY